MIKLDRILQLVTESKKVMECEELERIVNAQEDSSLRCPGIVAHYYRFFYFLTKEMKPKTVVELGTHTGISVRCLYEGYPEADVLTVDHHDRVMPTSFSDGIKYFVQDSYQRVDRNCIDLLFIDTLHDGIRAKKEYEIYAPFMADKSLIFFDDINLNPEMIKFWQELTPISGNKIELPVHGRAGFGMIYIDNGKEG